jgi:DNA-binding response OmpR family regulator
MARQRTILIADDDSELRSTLAEQLGLGDEFAVTQATDAAKAIQTTLEQRPDLLVIDVGLPDMDGREAVRLLRGKGFRNPIIILTGQTADDDAVTSLEAGANDYVTKPFKFAVLLARIRAHLRQLDASEDAVLRIGQYTFKPTSKQLISESGSKLRLTEKETAILKFLYRANSQVVARDILLKEVWGYSAQVTTHTLETHIYRLRQKIERDPANATLLLTDGGGYRLVQ